jgi:hypothetical protein
VKSVRPGHLSLAVALAIGAMACLPASAQQAVYRCADNTYSHMACAGGSVVPSGDPRSSEQKSAADEVNRRSGHAADALERERLRDEREARQRRAAVAPTAQSLASRPPNAARHGTPNATRKKSKAAAMDNGLYTVTDGQRAPQKKKRKKS